ncbi:MAG: hypothetical protein V1724_03510 [Chloroflexota bacterium]
MNDNRVYATSTQVERGRYSLDFEALDAWLELIRCYQTDQDFLAAVDHLLADAPASFYATPAPTAEDGPPAGASQASLLFPEAFGLHSHATPGPGALQAVKERFSPAWQELIDRLGEQEPWLQETKDTAKEWGLDTASWG